MAKDSDRLRGGFDMGETGGALSGLLAEEDELDRRALWRLGNWAAVSVGAVVVALITNQSSIGQRREQIASSDLLKQAQQLQLTAKEGQNETRRLASAVETLNSDRDRLYSRVAVIEQGLDSVTGSIARQVSATSPPNAVQANTGQATASQVAASQAAASQATASQATASQVMASQTNASQTGSNTVGPASTSAVTSISASSPTPASTASPAPAVTATAASIETAPAAAKPTPAPAVATAPATLEKQDKQASAASPSEPGAAMKSAAAPQANSAQQAAGSLMASKSMMGPPDPGAGKLIEPAPPPKAMATAPMPQVAAVAPKAVEAKAVEAKVLEGKAFEGNAFEGKALGGKASAETESDAVATVPAQRTEFGVDVGGANSIPGLRALWRGLLKSRTNTALTKLRPIIVIKENNTGLGMQLRLVAGPISDAAAAAKICATMSDRSCSTSVFEGQRLALNADETEKTEAGKSDVKPEADSKTESASKPSTHNRHYGTKHPKVEEAPKPEKPSTLSQIFGRR